MSTTTQSIIIVIAMILLLTDYILFTLGDLELCDWSTVVDNMASSLPSGKQSDPRMLSKQERSVMFRGEDKIVEIDTLRAFTIPKMKKAKHGLLRRCNVIL